MKIYQFIYIWPTSFTEYATVEITRRIMPIGLRLKISALNTQGITAPPPNDTHTHTLKSLGFVFNKDHFIVDRDLS